MKNALAVLFFAVMLNSVGAAKLIAADSMLESIPRRIGKEPKYESTPRYLLLALGPEASTHVWVVEDGRKLYVDTNASGDLTDDGPPLEPNRLQNFDYLLAEFATPGRPAQKDFQLRRWNYGETVDDSYGLSITLDGKTPMYAGWFGSFWGATPGEASVIYFGGPLTPRMLRYKEFTLDSGPRRLSVAFANPGLGSAATSLLSIDALAADVMPVLNIEWPSTKTGPPLRTSHRLDQRCCYWEFYTTDFEVPAEAIVGTAKVTIELPEGAMPLTLTTTKLEVPVVAPK